MSLKSTFSYIHWYLTYTNIAWASTHITTLKLLPYKHKHFVCIVFNEGRLSHAKSLLKILNALNVFKVNLYQHLNSDIPAIFNGIVKKPEHKYPTKFLSLNITSITKLFFVIT